MAQRSRALRNVHDRRSERVQLLDTKQVEESGTCKLFLNMRDGGVYQLACSSQDMDYMNLHQRNNQYSSFDVTFVASRRAEQQSTGIDGHLQGLVFQRHVSRATFQRLARMTGFGQQS